jgi:ankyrin repeat protein
MECKRIPTGPSPLQNFNGLARFRWVFCQLDALKSCLKPKHIREALRSLPKTLDETYARILMNIPMKYRQEARRALLWLAFSKRPLRIEKVAEAAVVDPQANPPFDPQDRFCDPCNNILEILGSLVTTSSDSTFSDGLVFDSVFDSDSSLITEIRLAHLSVQEYLVSERIQHGDAREFGATNVAANDLIVKSCLLYILHYNEADSKTASRKDLECFPLLQYSCQFWYTHVKSIPVGNQKLIDPVIFQLFLSDTALLSWLRVHRPDERWQGFNEIPNDIGTPLYYASDIGLQTVVQLLVEEGADVDAKTSNRETALHRAADHGHKTVARLLLENKADVNAKDESGKTALYLAARNRHETVVRLLLEEGADVNAKNGDGETALYWAAYHGHETVVRLLLEEGADVNAKNEDGETGLYWAANYGHEAVARLLLENGANVNAKDRDGRTALYWAARCGHEAVVRLLLDKELDVNANYGDGGTASYWAAYHGNEMVVRLLLEKGADVDAKDEDGKTALYGAAWSGHENVARLLAPLTPDS